MSTSNPLADVQLEYGFYSFAGPDGLSAFSLARSLQKVYGEGFDLRLHTVSDTELGVTAPVDGSLTLIAACGRGKVQLANGDNEFGFLHSGDVVRLCRGEQARIAAERSFPLHLVEIVVPACEADYRYPKGRIAVDSLPDDFSDESPTARSTVQDRRFRRVILGCGEKGSELPISITEALLNPDTTAPHFHPTVDEGGGGCYQLYVVLDDRPHNLTMIRLGAGRDPLRPTIHVYREPRRDAVTRLVAKPGDVLLIPPGIIHHVFGGLVAVVNFFPAQGSRMETRPARIA